MPRHALSVLASSALLFATTAASAQTAPAPAAAAPTTATHTSLGEQGQLIFGAERVLSIFGYQSFKTTATIGNTTTSVTSSGSSVSFLSFNPTGPIGGNGGGIGVPVFYSVPRLGFDYVVIPNLTVGGSMTLVLPLGASRTTQTSGNGQTQSSSVDGATTTIFGLAPRVGYTIALSELFAIWPRAGFSFYTASLSLPPDTTANTQDTYSITQWALDAEGLFVFTPFPHVGVVGGLALDVPLSGTYKLDRKQGSVSQSASSDASMWHVGLNAGLIVYF
jgi:hypothetical protein